MSGHYCTEHKVVFFKKGQMRGYAHPIEGSDPVKWCNEPEDGGDPIPEEIAQKPTEPNFSGEERGMWWKEVGLNYRAGKLEGATGKAIMIAYWAKLFAVLGITREK